MKTQRLYEYWVSRLGNRHVTVIYKELDLQKTARKVKDKANAIVAKLYKNDRGRLDSFIVGGFCGPFHQTIFMRRVKKTAIAERLKVGEVGKTLTVGVRLRLRDQISSNRIRVLLHCDQGVEFLVENETFKRLLPVPAVVDLNEDVLVVKALTFRPYDWEPIIGVPVSRALTAVSPLTLRDQVLEYLSSPQDPLVGSMIDYSARAIDAMKQPEVDTYHGKYLEFGGGAPKGNSSHATRGSRTSRKGLRSAMPSKFQDLVSSGSIEDCELFFAKDAVGLRAKTKLRLRPVIGELVLRVHMDDGDIDDFVAYCTS